jgi:cytosine/adenosine deaminase-related metal-dependent hydrolase
MNAEFLQLELLGRLAGPLALTHVTVIPMDAERELSDHTLVIEKGVVRALGPTREVDTMGLRVIDGSDRYVMPGLADM